MKNFRFLMMAVAGCMAFISCDSDDDNGSNANADLVGTYNMTSWNAPMAMDFDGNGMTSANFMTESSCYNNSRITLNNNGTYNMTYNSMGITGTTVNCGTTENTSGTWKRNGNNIVTTSTSGGTSTNSSYSFSQASGSNAATMTRSMTNVQYPSWNGTTASWANGNVNMVFSQQ